MRASGRSMSGPGSWGLKFSKIDGRCMNAAPFWAYSSATASVGVPKRLDGSFKRRSKYFSLNRCLNQFNNLSFFFIFFLKGPCATSVSSMVILKKILYGSLIGIVLLTPLIWLQVHYKVQEFTQPRFLGLPVWAPLGYAVIFIAMALVFPPLEELLTATFTFKHRYIFMEFLPIYAAFLGPIFTREYPYLIVFLLAIYVVARLGFFHAKWDWLFFLIGALIGPTVEALLVGANLYHFENPDFLGLPYWLCLEWGMVTMSGRRIVNVVESLALGAGKGDAHGAP